MMSRFGYRPAQLWSPSLLTKVWASGPSAVQTVNTVWSLSEAIGPQQNLARAISQRLPIAGACIV